MSTLTSSSVSMTNDKLYLADRDSEKLECQSVPIQPMCCVNQVPALSLYSELRGGWPLGHTQGGVLAMDVPLLQL